MAPTAGLGLARTARRRYRHERNAPEHQAWVAPPSRPISTASRRPRPCRVTAAAGPSFPISAAPKSTGEAGRRAWTSSASSRLLRESPAACTFCAGACCPRAPCSTPASCRGCSTVERSARCLPQTAHQDGALSRAPSAESLGVFYGRTPRSGKAKGARRPPAVRPTVAPTGAARQSKNFASSSCSRFSLSADRAPALKRSVTLPCASLSQDPTTLPPSV